MSSLKILREGDGTRGSTDRGGVSTTNTREGRVRETGDKHIIPEMGVPSSLDPMEIVTSEGSCLCFRRVCEYPCTLSTPVDFMKDVPLG